MTNITYFSNSLAPCQTGLLLETNHKQSESIGTKSKANTTILSNNTAAIVIGLKKCNSVVNKHPVVYIFVVKLFSYLFQFSKWNFCFLIQVRTRGVLIFFVVLKKLLRFVKHGIIFFEMTIDLTFRQFLLLQQDFKLVRGHPEVVTRSGLLDTFIPVVAVIVHQLKNRDFER